MLISARLLLSDDSRALHGHSAGRKDHNRSNDLIQSAVSNELLDFTRQIREQGGCEAVETTPFCLEAIYRVGVYYARLRRSSQSESAMEAYEDVKVILKSKSERWKAAST